MGQVRPDARTVHCHAGNNYGGHFWLVPDNRTDVPKDAYLHERQSRPIHRDRALEEPRHRPPRSRLRRQGFNQWDMTREVLKAIKYDDPIPRVNPIAGDV